MQQSLAGLNAEMRVVDSTAAGMGQRGIKSLGRWGSQVQWAGRQLQYNFTLPIVLAGLAATKFALDNEAAMVRVIKVYGDGSAAFNKLSQTEIPALAKAFEQLSNEFGVNQAATINIAADWAAAGASGLALAKSVKLTMETMILGEMEAAEATQALISIQAQYGLSIDELTSAIDTMNMVENQTATSMQGLVTAFARSAGSARSAGVDVRHLAAMISAITPAAGTAAQAGNALKTILTRLEAPTKQASEALAQMGIDTDSLAWNSLNGAQQIELLAKKFQTLGSAQRNQAAAVIAGRYQVNRFQVLLRDVGNSLDGVTKGTSYYGKALESTQSALGNYNQKVKELNTVLQSNPQKLKQIWVILQNAMADIIQPAIPLILYLAQSVAKLFQWFSTLNPSIQKLALVFLLLLAAVGPIVRYIGSITTLFFYLSKAAHLAALAMVDFVKVFARIILLPVGAIASGLSALLGGIGRLFLLAWTGIYKAWGLLTRAAVIVVNGYLAAMTAATKFIAIGFLAIWTGAYSAWFVLTRSAAVIFSGIWAATVAGLGAVITGAIPLISGAVAAMSGAIMVALTSPWTYAIAAVLILLVTFRSQIASAIGGVINWISDALEPLGQMFSTLGDQIISAFYALPAGVQNAMIAVVNIVYSAVMQVYELFSYLNPFAHHSPSLVESVTKGVAEIKKQYASLGNVGAPFAKAARDLAAYKKAASALPDQASVRFGGDRKNVKEQAPSALPAFDALVNDYRVFNKMLDAANVKLTAQQAVVDRWRSKLDAANETLDKQRDKLSKLQDTLDALNSAYQDHQDVLDAYASANLVGMKAMSDAIFENQIAQKKLQLQIAQWEQANGTMEDAANKMAKLQGELEKLYATASELRAKGAGSDILGPINAQIAALQAQQAALGTSIQNSPVSDLQAQLDELAKQGNILDLQQSINFDPLTRAIDDLANAQKELTYDEIVAGIKREQAAQAALKPKIDAATKAVADQQAAVDAATKARDRVQASYDRESKQLDRLQAKYDKINDVINQITDALQTMSAAAQAAATKAGGRGGSGAGGGAGPGGALPGNVPDVGGAAKLGREGGLGDQSALIDQFTKDQAKKVGELFGQFDLFAPIREKWNEFLGWWSKNISPMWTTIKDGLSSVFGDDPFGGIRDAWNNFVNGGFVKRVKDIFKSIADWIGKQARDAKAHFTEPFRTMWTAAQEIVKRAWEKLKPVIVQFGDIWKPLLEATGHVWAVLKPILEALFAAIMLVVSVALSTLSELFRPVFDAIIGIVEGAMKIIHGVIKLVLDLINGDWSAAWNDIVEILDGVWNIIYNLIKGAIGIVIGVIKGFVKGVINWFKWLYDKLVGHSIIPDMVKAIVSWFTRLPGMVLSALASLGTKLLNLFTSAMTSFWNGAKNVWSDKVYPWIKEIPGKIIDGLNTLKDKLLSFGGTIIGKFRDGIKAELNVAGGLLSYVKDIPGKIVEKLGDLGELLIGAGEDIIAGMVQGIKNKAGDLWDAIKSAFGKFARFIPGSPVKEGPLRVLNNGYAGGQIVRMMADGATANVPYMQRAFANVAASALSSMDDEMSRAALKRMQTGIVRAGTGMSSGTGSPGSTAQQGTGTGTVIVINGNLEFPNISSGDEADKFIDNLKKLSR